MMALDGVSWIVYLIGSGAESVGLTLLGIEETIATSIMSLF